MMQINSPEIQPLRLTGTLEIYQVEAIRQIFLEALASRAELVLDLGAVERCDAAGAQLLWSAAKTALQTGKLIRFENIPAPVVACWTGLGLPAEFFTKPVP